MANSSLNTPYLILSGIVIVAVVAILTIFQPMLRTISETRDTIQARQIVLSEREAHLNSLDEKIAALASQAQHEQQLNVVLPVQDDTEDILRLVHQAESTSGGVVRSVDNISVGIQSATNARRARGEGVNIPENISPLGFEIEFSGSYQQLRVFLENIQRAPRLLDITSLEIIRDQQQVDVIGATMTAQFYRYQSPSN